MEPQNNQNNIAPQNNPPVTPVTPQASPVMNFNNQAPKTSSSSTGSIIGTIIIIAIIILGGLYFWGKRIEEAKLKQSLVTDTTVEETEGSNEAAVIKSVGTSDDLDSIEKDLSGTNLDNLGAEME